jgi:hypothetical protein
MDICHWYLHCWGREGGGEWAAGQERNGSKAREERKKEKEFKARKDGKG